MKEDIFVPLSLVQRADSGLNVQRGEDQSPRVRHSGDQPIPGSWPAPHPLRHLADHFVDDVCRDNVSELVREIQTPN